VGKSVPVVVPSAGDKRVTSVATGEELELSDLGVVDLPIYILPVPETMVVRQSRPGTLKTAANQWLEGSTSASPRVHVSESRSLFLTMALRVLSSESKRFQLESPWSTTVTLSGRFHNCNSLATIVAPVRSLQHPTSGVVPRMTRAPARSTRTTTFPCCRHAF
jgi:hypothetical protein